MDSMHDHSHHGHHHEMNNTNMNDAATANIMDHSDHLDHGEKCGGMDHMMMMYFHLGYTETILFEIWKIDSVGGLVISMIGIFIMALLYEGLKYFRDYLFKRDGIPFGTVTVPATKGTTVTSTSQNIQLLQPIPSLRFEPNMLNMCSVSHLIQTFLQMLQVFVSYLLMLVFMTYNTWLCLALILGSGVGYFLFGWKKSIVVDITEHCH